MGLLRPEISMMAGKKVATEKLRKRIPKRVAIAVLTEFCQILEGPCHYSTRELDNEGSDYRLYKCFKESHVYISLLSETSCHLNFY